MPNGSMAHKSAGRNQSLLSWSFSSILDFSAWSSQSSLPFMGTSSISKGFSKAALWVWGGLQWK